MDDFLFRFFLFTAAFLNDSFRWEISSFILARVCVCVASLCAVFYNGVCNNRL